MADSIADRFWSTKAEKVNQDLKNVEPKRAKLKDLDIFVLDNSIRETTVGQLRGHTIENKWQIYNEVKKIGFKHTIVTSFSHMTRIGDTFIQQLHDAGEDMEFKWAFAELADKVIDKEPDKSLPIGLKKCKQLGIKNVIIEVDLVYYAYDYAKVTHEKMCELFDIRFKWIREHLAEDSRILINLRDYPDAMKKEPIRALKLINFLSSYKPHIFGIVFEESGKYFPEEIGVWTRAARDEMNACDFKEGHLLVHIHQQWGLLDGTQLECLANGADGIWAGLCEEGASMGHASSTVTLMNLIRLGNTKVQKKFNCSKLREAAIAVTKITTGAPPHPKQPIYGARALDHVFGLPQFDPEKTSDETTFNMAEFFGQEAVMRITTLADEKMIVTRMKKLFGEDQQYTIHIARKMKELMLEDLRDNRKEEYHSPCGLAMLFDRAGGKMTEGMRDAIEKVKPKTIHIQELIKEIHERWTEWDLRDCNQDDMLEFDAFYNGFLAPYFGCYRCSETIAALKAVDMNADGKVDWNEFSVYLKWAGHEYPETESSDELLDIAFRKGLIPAMQDGLVRTQCRL